MERYDEYFLMKEEDVVEYVRHKLDFMRDAKALHSKEIGDGNLNYVFRVWEEGGRSVIVKQAGRTLRISEEMKLPLDRNRIESEILLLQGRLAPGFVPKIYDYDLKMSACLMEDLSDYTLMRTALMQHNIYPGFADWISTFMADTLLPTTDVVMNHIEKKEMQRRYVNPALCEISEDLVFTEPYNDLRGRNNVFPPMADFVRRELYGDEALHFEVAQLKFDFMNNAQALIHGDLHTGSIFIRPEGIKVFDPEFAFYGPMGYDIGNVVANILFAWCNTAATLPEGPQRSRNLEWAENTMAGVVDRTAAKLDALYQRSATEPMTRAPGFRESYLRGIIEDTAGAAGLELNRRIVGMANVKDITTIADEKARVLAEKTCILAAKTYIKERRNLHTGADFLQVLRDAAAQAAK